MQQTNNMISTVARGGELLSGGYSYPCRREAQKNGLDFLFPVNVPNTPVARRKEAVDGDRSRDEGRAALDTPCHGVSTINTSFHGGAIENSESSSVFENGNRRSEVWSQVVSFMGKAFSCSGSIHLSCVDADAAARP